MQEHCAGFIIVRKDVMKFLVLEYGAGHWDFVKGHIEPGESEKTAALRELEEETGITTVEVLPDFSEKINYSYKRGSKLIPKTVTFFLALTNEKTVKLSHEHTNFEWLPFDKAHERITFNNAKEVLVKANDFLK